MDVILDETNKMDVLVKQLLELMKLENEKREFSDKEFNLAELIEETIRKSQVILQEQEIQVKFDPTKDRMVYADSFYVEQVFNNYFTLKFLSKRKKENCECLFLIPEKTLQKTT